MPANGRRDLIRRLKVNVTQEHLEPSTLDRDLFQRADINECLAIVRE